MTEHLPECPLSYIDYWKFSLRECICPYLRACEVRVLDAAQEAIEAAFWDALEALDPLDPQTITLALAAIDALRGDR